MKNQTITRTAHSKNVVEDTRKIKYDMNQYVLFS